MKPKDRDLSDKINKSLTEYEKQYSPLLGIEDPTVRAVLVDQMIDSLHRIKYVSTIKKRALNPESANPTSDSFDPLKAAIINQSRGDIDEAFWLVFIFVHFGKNMTSGWRLARDVYGRLGEKPYWNWSQTSSDPKEFRKWLGNNQAALKKSGKFGNHRKYESLNADSGRGTGEAFESYIDWVKPYKTHANLIQSAIHEAGEDPREVFDYLYRNMKVTRFGRMAKFDYLTMLGKSELAPIEAGSTYMTGATGPYTGSCLLFGIKKGILSRRNIDEKLQELDIYLDIGMQALEDSICNWQKSPNVYKSFRG